MLPFLETWSGESTEELLSLEGQYRVDSIVTAFEWAIQAKLESRPISREERYVLAVEALEREVNNGGYSQFFINPSNEFVDVIEEALSAIGCPKTEQITRNAIFSLGRGPVVTPKQAENAALAEDADVDAALEKCDTEFFKNDESIEDRLFNWIKANKAAIRVGAV